MSDKLYDEISKRINQLFGIHLKQRDWNSMENNLIKAAKLLKRKGDIEAISKWVLNPSLSANEYHALARTLTIGETFFFREITGLTFLADEIIPEFRKNNRKTLNIWSAGCSSGEEPYSIAIFLKENLPDFSKWDVKIFATDLNNEALSKARTGIYRPWSFRGLREDLLKKYFVKHENTYEVKDEIRSMVRFSNLNLVKESFPYIQDKSNGYDVIFCRNVLMYFSQPTIHAITEKFFQSLAFNGWLIIGQTELSVDIYNLFQRIKFKDGFFFRKGANLLTPLTENSKEKILFKRRTATNTITKPRKTINEKASRLIETKRTLTSQANTIQPSSPDIRESFKNAEYLQCIQLFENALSVDKLNEEELFYIAKAYANLGKYKEGSRVIEELISKNSTNPDFYYFYATILAEQDLWGEAEKNLVKALYLNPDFLSARFSRFMALTKLNKIVTAEKEGNNILSDIRIYDNNDLIPDMEGMTAGSLRQTIDLMQK